jgi:hypothetical protein
VMKGRLGAGSGWGGAPAAYQRAGGLR